MKALPLALTAAALMITSSAAAAQSATDAGCILLSNAFSKNAKDANAQKLAEASLYFYLGRIGDHATSAQLKTLFDTQAKTLDDKTAGPMMNACVNGFKSKMDLVQSLSPQPPAAAPQAQPKKQPQGR